jgi:superfamily II DNA or RNA helicase
MKDDIQINQIIMLPTESAIIFIQQLGRGLRKLMAT